MTSGTDTVTFPFRRLGSWALLIPLWLAGCSEKPATTPPPGTTTNRAPTASSSETATTEEPGSETGDRPAERRPRLRRLGETGVGQATAADLALQPDDWFEDVTARTGIESTYQNGREAERFFILESLGGGVAMVDFDLDGDLDLAFSGGGGFTKDDPVVISGRASLFYRNDGDWQFAERTAATRLDETPHYSHGFTVVDYDSDGWPDLFLSCYGHSRLYRNQGDGTFAEALTPEAFPANGWGTSAGWGDIDRDGHPDLYLGHYLDWDPSKEQVCKDALGRRDVCGPAKYPGAVGKFLHNEGDGTFTDWSQQVGLVPGVKGLGVAVCDFDDDGWLDFYAANDETPNQLYLGQPGGKFVESGKEAGVAFNEFGVEEGSMGLGVDDFDGDGRPDIWVTNFENEDNALYRNLGGGQFKHASVKAAVSGQSRMMVGFGTLMLDFDGDTWPDLFVCNGNAVYSMGQAPYEQKPQLFRNLAGARFENISRQGGAYFRTEHVGRGVAAGDLDLDGSLDVIVTHQGQPATILKNRRPAATWVKVRLRALQGAPEAVGSTVTLKTGSRPVVRQVTQGVGYLSQSDLELCFPLPAGTASADVEVRWLGRGTERHVGLTAQQRHLLIEGRGAE